MENAKTAEPVTRPLVVLKTGSDNSWHYQLHIPENLVYFTGHFPGLALLPGVTQIKWAVDFARAEMGCPAPTAIEKLKFMRPIVPGQRIELVLKAVGAGKIEFAYRDGHSLYSQGVLCHE